MCTIYDHDIITCHYRMSAPFKPHTWNYVCCCPNHSPRYRVVCWQHWLLVFPNGQHYKIGTPITTLTSCLLARHHSYNTDSFYQPQNHNCSTDVLCSPLHQNCNTDPYVHRRHNNYNADCLRTPMAPQLQHWLGVFNQNTWITALTLCAQPRRQNCDTDCMSSPHAPELQHQLPVFIQGTIITNLSSYFNPIHLYYNTNTLWPLQTSGQLHLNTVLTLSPLKYLNR